MKVVLLKTTMDKISSWNGAVFIPVESDCNDIPVGECIAEIKPNKQRTLTQNRAIHKYCSMVSDDLNSAGLDMKKVIKDEIDIPWAEPGAKEFLWRPIQKAMGLPESTADLTTDEVSKVYEVLSRHLAQKFGITTPFPSRHGD